MSTGLHSVPRIQPGLIGFAARVAQADLVVGAARVAALESIHAGRTGYAVFQLHRAVERAARILAGEFVAPLPEHTRRDGGRCGWSGLMSYSDRCPAGCGDIGTSGGVR